MGVDSLVVLVEWICWGSVALLLVGWMVRTLGVKTSRPARWLNRFPRASNFVAARTSWNTLAGLPLTLILCAGLLFLTIHASSLFDTTSDNRVAVLDLRVARFFLTVRTPQIVTVFTLVTAFGYWGVIFTLGIAVTLLFWMRGRSRYVAGIWLALLGNQTSVTVLKILFGRTRPDVAFYSESSFSFPSGHAAVSAAFFGYLTYVVLREKMVMGWKAYGVGSLAILLIGVSRLVLAEHYLSDVLGGYLVGGLWAFLGAVWVERGLSVAGHDVPAVAPPRRTAQIAVVGAALVVLWLVVANYERTRVLLPAVTQTAPGG